MCRELDAWNASMAELEARSTEFKKRFDNCALQVHFADSNYCLLFEDTQTLKQQLALFFLAIEKWSSVPFMGSNVCWGIWRRSN